MKQTKKKETTSEPEAVEPNPLPVPHEATTESLASNAGQKPVSPPAFPKPPRVPPFAQGVKIRQDNRSRFFSRTRRGSI